MKRFVDPFAHPREFNQQLMDFVRTADGPFSFLTQAMICGGEMQWTWFETRSPIQGSQMLTRMVLAEDWEVFEELTARTLALAVSV